VTLAATQLALDGLAKAETKDVTPGSVPTDSDPPPEFVSLKQINAGELSVGYAELGSANGAAVFLLHGWPYDIHSFADAAPLLAAKGYRVIVPYVRGYGSTRSLSADTRLANACRSAAVQCLLALACKRVPMEPNGPYSFPTMGAANGHRRTRPADPTRPGRQECLQRTEPPRPTIVTVGDAAAVAIRA
jgi:hypothetical protein